MLGPFGFHVIDGGTDTANFTVIAQLALTVILFNQAAELDLGAVVRRRDVTFRLLVIGIPLALLLGTATALLVLPVMPLWEAVCLAAIVAPTEVALIEPCSMTSASPNESAMRCPPRAASTTASRSRRCWLRWRWPPNRPNPTSGGGPRSWSAPKWYPVVGVAVGALGGRVVARSQRREWMSDTWAQLATLAIALVCFGAGERLHGSGFVAAFAGGLAFSFVANEPELIPRHRCPTRPASYWS